MGLGAAATDALAPDGTTAGRPNALQARAHRLGT